MSSTRFNRRLLLQGIVPATLFGLATPVIASQAAVVAYRDPGCGCCEKWAGLMQAAGFTITIEDDPDLAARKARLGVPETLAGCHTALIGAYVFEGHVPPADVIHFLREAPRALGLAVPGMPIGSPGMEMGNRREAYDVVMFTAEGAVTVFASHS